jgi:hypothetical protein
LSAGTGTPTQNAEPEKPLAVSEMTGLDLFRVDFRLVGDWRERIQQFAGALIGQEASKGVFVTTSSFSSGARDYAHRVPQRIILINGEELTRLMTQYRVGGPSPHSLLHLGLELVPGTKPYM